MLEKDPRRTEPPHALLCPCKWCANDRETMVHGKRNHKHWAPGVKSPLEDENRRAGKTLEQEVKELFPD